MRTIRIDPDLGAWRDQARALILAKVPPAEVIWIDSSIPDESLFSDETSPDVADGEFSVPKAFVDLARLASCHRDPRRWARLYSVLYRIKIGGDKHLLKKHTDDEIHALQMMAKAVRRDRHKMTAFVRFRKVGETADTGREQFVAWFEPEHFIVELTAPFFVKRFTGMDWSILTPEKSIHWDGKKLHVTDGVDKSQAPSEDALDELWRGYYKSIFNPARLKVKAMQAEMPKKYWKNLPEAPLIQELIQTASTRRDAMVAADTTAPTAVPKNAYIQNLHTLKDAPQISEIPLDPDDKSLAAMAKVAATCRACPLWENATQTVFGEGPEDARLMIVGEQPGDNEDLQGKPFIGPAGQLLDECLALAGIDRSTSYLTNTVKHFKWKPSAAGAGRKRRLHESPDRFEVSACKPWLKAELARVSPDTVVLLGATAARAVIRPDFKITKERGLVEGSSLAPRVIATVHPSYLLRIPDAERKKAETSQFVQDLKLAVI